MSVVVKMRQRHLYSDLTSMQARLAQHLLAKNNEFLLFTIPMPVNVINQMPAGSKCPAGTYMFQCNSLASFEKQPKNHKEVRLYTQLSKFSNT